MMVARTKPQPSAATPVRFTSATRATTGAPGRAGSVRLATVALLIAVSVGAAAYVLAHRLLVGETIRHLDAVRESAATSISRTLEESRRETADLAGDPRVAKALRDLRDGFNRAGDELVGRTPAKLAAYETSLSRYYDGVVLPAASAASGTAVTRDSLYPANDHSAVKDAPIILQSLYLASNKNPAGERQKLVDPRDGSSYSRAHAEQHPWLDAVARRNGWQSVLLVDADTSHVVYGSAKTPDTFTSLRDGPYREGALAAAVRASNADPQRGTVRFSDVERAIAYGGLPTMFAATPVFDGTTRIGTLVAVIGPTPFDGSVVPASGEQRWDRLGLGERGDVFLVGSDGTLRSTPRGFLESPAGYWEAAASEGHPVRSDSNPVALATADSAGVADALAGESVSGTFDTPAGPLLGSYGPIQIDGQRWALAVERPVTDLALELRPLLALLAAIALLACAVGWLLGGRLWALFGRRLHRATEVVQRSLRGDRTARIDGKGEKGEIADLSAAINRLLEERQAMIERTDQENQRVAGELDSLLGVVQEASGGNLTPRAPLVDGSLGNVARALNEMLEEVGGLVSSLKQTTGRVGASAGQIRTSAEQASRGAATQAKECGSTTAVAEELRESNEQIARRCADTVETARRTEQASRLGQTAITDLLSGMDGLQRETRSATVKIKRLGERSMQISAIIGAISKMSAQTDMLALNAAIEASRAGEHGQGFTVVAEEVRKLAERAAAATKEIERLIAGIQSDVNEAVSGMERQGERLEVQSAAASQAQHALDRVLAVTTETTAAVQQITGAAEAQARNAERLGQSVRELAESAQGLQQTTEVARRTSGDLISAFEELDARASRFHA